MPTISVVLATYNEENNLEACLNSVKDLAEEIIVVDGTSTDKTVEIAKKFGAKVKITTNKPIFHINKQVAIDMATKDWVLQLDADERVTPELAGEIRKAIQQFGNKAINGFWIPRKNWFLGRFLMKGGVYPDFTLRLYKRGKGKLPQKSVHEQAEVLGKVAYLKNPLIHVADPAFGRYLIRWNRYTSLIRDELKQEKPGFFGLFQYLFLKPISWFALSYIRHKGFMDGWQGFVFSLFSSLRFPIAYLKYVLDTKIYDEKV